MQKIISIVLVMIYTSCVSQTIDDRYSGEWASKNGVYYKDISNFNQQFVGTWLYTNGNDTLKIIIQTKNHLYINDGFISCYSDAIKGEYQYIENGVEKVNTLSNLNSYTGNDYFLYRDNSALFGSYKVRAYSKPQCNECPSNEMRLKMSLKEPNYNTMGVSSNSFVIRRFFEDGVEKLKVWFSNTTQTGIEDNNGNVTSPAPYSLPTGEYVLTKQY